MRWGFILLLLCVSSWSLSAQNPSCDGNRIAQENCLDGSDAWRITNFTDSIAGYAYPPSITAGETVTLYVDTDAPNYDVDLFRMGYYGGTGGRHIEQYPDLEGQRQPGCHHDFETGLTSCANWESSLDITVPEDWVSGVYVATLTRGDTGGQNYAMFVIRDDRPADILYQQSLFTFHAYNNYGGKSIYNFNSGECLTVTEHPRAASVSLHRPFVNGQEEVNSFFTAEYPMLRWLEQQGYDVTYTTNLDIHQRPINPAHTAFFSVGHDEYWTQEMFEHVRDAGVHLAFFSANTSYWRVRLEDDPWTGTPDSIITSYKTTEAGIEDPSGHPTGTFRDPTGVDQPENSLIGVMYIGDNDFIDFPLRVSAEYTDHRLYRHTDLPDLPDDTYVNLGPGMFGWEWDAVVENGLTPPDLTILAETPVAGFLLRDAGNHKAGTSDIAQAHTTLYETPGGKLVFASGTIQWSWGLGAQSIETTPVDPYVQQMTVNLLADMGLQPATPTDDIILDGDEGIVSVPEVQAIPADAPAPTISGIRLEQPGNGLLQIGREATLIWQTDVPTIGQLWLSIDSVEPVESWITYETMQQDYTVMLNNLVPNTDYRYRIVAIDENGQIGISPIQAFHTRTNVLVQGGSGVLDALRQGRCWVVANSTESILLGGAGIVAVLGVVGVAFTRRRQRRKLT